MTDSGPVLPREHGAWAILCVPLLVGSAFARAWTWEYTLLWTCALAFFLASNAAGTMIRGERQRGRPGATTPRSGLWTAIYGSVGTALSVPLLARGYSLLLPIGATGVLAFIGAFLVRTRFPGSIGNSLLGVAGLTLGAPAAYYVGTGRLDVTAGMLWLLNALFFGSGVLYVHMKIGAAALKKQTLTIGEKFSLGACTLSYYAGMLTLIGGLAALGWISLRAIVAFLPVTLHVCIGTITLSGQVRFKRLGFLLLGQSVLFAVLIVIFGT